MTLHFTIISYLLNGEMSVLFILESNIFVPSGNYYYNIVKLPAININVKFKQRNFQFNVSPQITLKMYIVFATNANS